MNVKPLSTLQCVLTAGLAWAHLECASSAACLCLLLIALKFHQLISPLPAVCFLSVVLGESMYYSYVSVVIYYHT